MDSRQHWHSGKQTKTRYRVAQTVKKIAEKKNEINGLLGIHHLGADLHGDFGAGITCLCGTIHRGVYRKHIQESSCQT